MSGSVGSPHGPWTVPVAMATATAMAPPTVVCLVEVTMAILTSVLQFLTTRTTAPEADASRAFGTEFPQPRLVVVGRGKVLDMTLRGDKWAPSGLGA